MPALPSLGLKPWKQALEDWLLTAHNADGTHKAGAVPASGVTYAGGTGISATDVEGAIDELAVEKADITSLSAYQVTSQKGAASGYASLDGATKVPVAQIPDLSATYQVRTEKGAVNGYASLDGTGKVPSAQLPVVPAGANGTLALRPAAAAGNSGTFYYASDQDVLYFSTGAAWLRIGLPPGATTTLYSNTVPTGWIAYDGTALPASTGIYADLYAHLGNTTATPDTRGRILVHKGTHADVDVLGDNDGTALANRTPKHNSTLTGSPAVGTLSVNSHTHGSTALGVTGAPGVGTLATGSHTHGSTNLGVTGAPGAGTLAVTGAPTVGTLAVTGAPGVGTLAVTGAPTAGTLAVNSHTHALVAATITGAPALSGAVSNGSLGIQLTAGVGWTEPGHSHATESWGNVAGGGATHIGSTLTGSDPFDHYAYVDGANSGGYIYQNPSFGLTGGISNGSLGVGVGSLDVGGNTDGATATIGGAPGIGTLAVGGTPGLGTLAVGGAPGLGSLAVGGAPTVGTLDVNGSTDANTATVTGAPDVGTLDVNGSTDGATATIAGSPAIGTLASGPGGTLPVDTPAFITFSVVIAKL
jgi:hypothetical protein